MSSEIRQNKITKQWVIYAPDRGDRPRDFPGEFKAAGRANLPPHDANCPFCPGNKEKLPEVIAEMPGKQSWQTRVVPNKFPALTEDGSSARYQTGIYRAMPGYGKHEVIIESPKHNEDIATMPIDAVEIVIDTYRKRYIELMAVHDNMMVIIFRNHGPEAGTSLHHPHSQLVVTSVVPHYVRQRDIEAQRYFDETGRCIFCDILAFEQDDRQRVVLESEHFLAFVPFAAEVPYETWIMPKAHNVDFSDITGAAQADLAYVLHTMLARLHTRLNDPDYNYIVHNAPQYKAGEPHLHWYVQIRPRLKKRAGFEIGSGMSINPSLPENDAVFLKDS
jgi:UDPglucose--hexose-1-phosphate uridylyltransferase